MAELRSCHDARVIARPIESPVEDKFRLGFQRFLDQDHYTVGELASLLEVDDMFIRRAIRLGELRATPFGGLLGLRSADVLNWLIDGE